MSSLIIRPMRPADVTIAEEVSAVAFLEVDRESRRVRDPEPQRRSPERARLWRERAEHLLGTDPDGCWVAESDGVVGGFVLSARRDLLWVLGVFAVRPGLQGLGVGTRLLQAALGHSRSCLRGLLSASDDPRAFRLYHRAGFVLHPQMHFVGTVDRAALTREEDLGGLARVRDGSAADFHWMDSLDRARREAAHGPDHALLARLHRLIVLQSAAHEGYAYLDTSGSPVLLAASDRRTASRLLTAALLTAPADESVEVDGVTGANDWAVDVALRAGLAPAPDGYLGVRGMRAPAPYLAHPALL